MGHAWDRDPKTSGRSLEVTMKGPHQGIQKKIVDLSFDISDEEIISKSASLIEKVDEMIAAEKKAKRSR